VSEPDWKRRHEALCDAANQRALTLTYLNPGWPKSHNRSSKGQSFMAMSALVTPSTWVGDDERQLVEGGRRVYRYYIYAWTPGSWEERREDGWERHEVFAELERPVESTTDKVLKTQT